MAPITLKGTPCNTSGQVPQPGDTTPDFSLITTDLEVLQKTSFPGKRLLLNCFPSIDTPVCATSVRTFNERASALENTAVLCVSADLPFAHKRFCGTEGIENAISVSTFRDPQFGKQYGIEIVNGPLQGLLARAVIVLDEQGKVIFSQLVPEIAEEPNYDSALAALT